MRKSIALAALLGITCLVSVAAAEPRPVAQEEMDGPYTIAYRIFRGDYRDNGPVFASLVEELRAAGIASPRTLGIFFDDPATTAPRDRRCICGVVIEEKDWPRIEGLPRSLRIQHIPRALRIVCRYPVTGPTSYFEGGSRCYPVLSAFARTAGRTPIGSFELYGADSISYIVQTLEKEASYPRTSGPISAVDTPASHQVAWPDPDWQESTPEAQGMDSGQLARSLDLVPTMWDLGEIDSLLVIRHGRMVLESYFHPNTPQLRHELHSVTKSVTSTLVGIAARQGCVQLDAPVLSYFPQHAPRAAAPDKAAMTVRHLLNMQSGLEFQEFPLNSTTNTHWRLLNSGDWSAFSLDLPMAARPGTRFNYSDGDMAILGGILRTATGARTADFANEHLFAPLGITNWDWRRDPQGNPLPNDGLFLTPRDMAKIGYLYLRGGVWKGKRILPEYWTKDIANRSVETGALPQRYGMLWWVDESSDMYSACGTAGQYIIAMPRQDIVVVVTAKQGLSVGNPGFTEIAHTLIMPAVTSEGPLPENARALSRLRDRVRRFASPEPQPVPQLPGAAAHVSGRKILFDPTALGFSSVTLSFGGDWAVAEMESGETRERFPIGLDGLQRTSQVVNGVSYASFGFWEDGSTFCVESRVLQGDFLARFRFRFQDDDVTLTHIIGDELWGSRVVHGRLIPATTILPRLGR